MKHLALCLLSLAAIMAGCSSQEFDEPNSLAEDLSLNNQKLDFRTSQEALSIALKAVGEISPTGDVMLSRGMADISLYEGNSEISEPTTKSIYVVNFSTGGYALVPADAEGDEVVGVSDIGNFIVNKDDPNDVGSYILTLASNFSSSNSLVPITPPTPIDTVPNDNEEYSELHNGRWCYVRTTRDRTHEGPLMVTNWHQHEPYSHLCPTYATTDSLGNDTTPHYAVGCVPLAMAQIMTYHRHPATHVDRAGISYTYAWDLITQKSSYGKYEFTPASLELAKLTWSVAKDIIKESYQTPEQTDEDTGWSWGRNFSRASASKAPQLFREFDYSIPQLSLTDYNFESIKNQIDQHQPVFIDGHMPKYTPKGTLYSGPGHAWVIDGYMHNYTEVRYVDVETGEIVDVVRTKNDEMVHCNMGSKNVPPGYFTSGIFNTADGDYSYFIKMIIDIAPN